MYKVYRIFLKNNNSKATNFFPGGHGLETEDGREFTTTTIRAAPIGSPE
jgi:hypothetical protein